MKTSRLIAAIAFAGLVGAGMATPAFADWHHDPHWRDPHWHRPWHPYYGYGYAGPGVVVAPPPAVYAAPPPAPVYVAPPPVVGLGLNFNIR